MTGDHIDHLYRTVLRREPTSTEHDRLLRLGNALHLATDDPLWSVVIALEHYERLYELIPARIAQATSELTDVARRDAKTFFEAERSSVQATLADAVRDNLVGQMKIELRQQTKLAVAVIVGGFLLTMVFSVAIGRYWGRDTEHSRYAWSDGKAGEYAQRLTASGAMAVLLNCYGNGTAVINRDGLARCDNSNGPKTLPHPNARRRSR